jgi:hypothetical protein
VRARGVVLVCVCMHALARIPTAPPCALPSPFPVLPELQSTSELHVAFHNARGREHLNRPMPRDSGVETLCQLPGELTWRLMHDSQNAGSQAGRREPTEVHNGNRKPLIGNGSRQARRRAHSFGIAAVSAERGDVGIKRWDPAVPFESEQQGRWRGQRNAAKARRRCLSRKGGRERRRSAGQDFLKSSDWLEHRLAARRSRETLTFASSLVTTRRSARRTQHLGQ